MSKADKTSMFLANIKRVAEAEPPAPVKQRRKPAAQRPVADKPVPDEPTPPPATNAPPERHSSRQGKTHFGGYVTDETLELAAVLRVRLKKDNSALITYALEELHRSHDAKRKFGDA